MADDTDEPTVPTQETILADLYGRILALETLVINLVASHARTFPSGVMSQMLDDTDKTVEAWGNTLGPGVLTDSCKIALRSYCQQIQSTVDIWDERRDREEE